MSVPAVVCTRPTKQENSSTSHTASVLLGSRCLQKGKNMAQGSCNSGWTESAQFNENGYNPHFVFFINICRVSVANLNVSADKYILYFASFFLECWRKHVSWSQLMCSPWVSRANSFKLRMIFMSLPNSFFVLFIISSEVHQTIPSPHHARGHFLCQPAREGSWPQGTAWLLRCLTTSWKESCLGPGRIWEQALLCRAIAHFAFHWCFPLLDEDHLV